MMRRASVLALFVVLALGAAPAANAETHVFSITGSPTTHIASTREPDGVTTSLRDVNAKAVATDGRYVFWSEQRIDGGAIGRMDLDGANADPSWLTGLDHGMGAGLATGGGRVCWNTTYGPRVEIGCVPVAADGSHGAPTQGVVGDQAMNGLAVDGAGHLYWGRATSVALPGSIARANGDGGDVRLDFIPNVIYPRGLAVNGDRLFYTESYPQSLAPPPATIKTALLPSGAPLAIVSLPADTNLGPLAANGDHVYWTENSGLPKLGRATLTGSDQNRAFAAPGGPLLSVATEPGGSDTLDVDLSATAADGRPLDSGGLTEQETFDVHVTLRNSSPTQTIKDLNYAGGAPLTIDGRSIARIGVLAAPAGAPPTTLGPGESKTFDYRLTAAADGVAAAIAKITGRGGDGTAQEATGSLKLTVTQAGRLNAALAQWARVQGLDQLLLTAARKLYKGWDKRGLAMQAQLRKVLSPAERKRWYGTAKQAVSDNVAVARALLMGRAPSATAAQFPRQAIAGVSADELYAEYNNAFKSEVGRGAAKYVEKWKDLGAGAKKQVGLAYAESGLAVNYIMNTASRDQREEAEAMVLAFSDGVVKDTSSYAAWTKSEAGNLLNDGQAAIYALANLDQGAKDAADAMSVPFDQDEAARRAIAQYADDQPVKYQREMAKLDAKIFNAGMEVVADTVAGGAATKLVTSAGKVVQLGKKGAALLNMAKATEVVDESGKLAKGVEAVKDTKNALGVGISGEEAAAMLSDGEKSLRNVEGATVVQSSDYGNVYKLPNVGGVPEVTLDAKASILKGVEDDFAKTFGKPIELAEVLKPSTELRKPGAVAKLELTGQKTGKAAMVDAGMPPDALGEAALWRPKVKPRDIPGFSTLSESRQAAAIKEYENALKANQEWASPAAGSKTAKLKSVLGKEGTVALDDKPWPGGLQRFVNAEFELVKVEGKYADAYLIRVKKYEVVVKDMARGGKVVNTKTVVKSTKALAQGVDADAVAVMKVAGRDNAGKPILASLDAGERSFAMSRYIDRNVKARAAGLVTDLAEHGATLVMDDADAAHAGFLLPKFGVPFMPEDVGVPFLRRIAKFVAPAGVTADQMFQNMLTAVRGEGGFGQHAVIITKDTRYLGEVPIALW
jgi:hypothetical protein